jgi:glycogen synthase
VQIPRVGHAEILHRRCANTNVIAAQDMKKTKVLLVGPYPPPYGGNAIQMCAWLRCLAEIGSYECCVLNIGESRRGQIEGCISVYGLVDLLKKLWGFAHEGYIIHLHTNGHNFKSWLMTLACVALGMPHGKRTVVAFGSGDAPHYIREAWLIRPLIKLCLCLAGWFICMNEPMRVALIQAGARPDRISIVHGFFGINSTDTVELPTKLSEYVASHYPLLGATVYVPESGTLYQEYGIDLLVKAIGNLRTVYPHIGTIIMGPTEDARKQIGELRSDDQSVMFTGPLPHDLAQAAIKRLTVFVRPTFTDGDSISVREALALQVPVVASDTDYRPEGVTIFKKGDLDDLLVKVSEVMRNPRAAVVHAPESQASSIESLLEVYRNVAMTGA